MERQFPACKSHIKQAGQGSFVTSHISEVHEVSMQLFIVQHVLQCTKCVCICAHLFVSVHILCKCSHFTAYVWDAKVPSQSASFKRVCTTSVIVAGTVQATGLELNCWQRNRSVIGLYCFNSAQTCLLALQIVGNCHNSSIQSLYISSCLYSLVKNLNSIIVN